MADAKRRAESVQYSERYKVKGTLECGNRHIYEETLIEIYLMAWNRLLECRDLLMPEWEEKIQGGGFAGEVRGDGFYGDYKGCRADKETGY